MIDFVKITINDMELCARLLNDPVLTFSQVRGKRISGKYKDLLFEVYDSGRVAIEGSLHKYFNEGLHNWNDFTRVDLWDTIYEVCRWLQIHPSRVAIRNIEYGVNIRTSTRPKEILKQLVGYKNKSFKQPPVKGKGIYKHVQMFDYILKCYDKGTQFGLSEHLLRFEVKVIKMRCLREIGIGTLEDLQNASKLSRLGNLLLEAWENIVLDEDFPEAELSVKEKAIVEAATNVNKFEDLTPKKRNKVLSCYTRIVSKYMGEGSQKEKVKQLLKTKWEELQNWDVCTELHNTGEADCNTLNAAKSGDVCTDLQGLQNLMKKGCLHSSSIQCNCSLLVEDKESKITSENTCKITGINIGNQRPGSRFVSERTLRENPEVANQRMNFPQRQNRRKHNHPESYYLAHNIRNKDSNARNNLKRRINRATNGSFLFDQREFVRLSSEQVEVLKSSLNIQRTSKI